MHPLVNHMIQLQQLTLIRDEQKVAHPKKRHASLDQAIKTMTDKLPREIRDDFVQLHKKDSIVITPITEEICAVCGMRLPISLIQAVRQGREVLRCPTCARMLYYPESGPKRVGRRARRLEAQKAGISRFTSHTLMVPRLESTDKEGAISELATKMETEGFIEGADQLIDAALEREAVLSTAVDHGLAFPHVRGVEGGGLALALGCSPKGIVWEEGSKSLTHIIFMLAIPTAASAFYLKLLAGLAEAFMKAEKRKALLAEKDPEKLWKALTKATRATIK